MEITGVPKKEAIEKATKLLEIVGLADKANSYPSQLSDTFHGNASGPCRSSPDRGAAFLPRYAPTAHTR